MSGDYQGAKYWSEVARRMKGRYHLDKLLCEQKKKVHLDLIRRWADVAGSQMILKTDLFEEALGLDQFLFELAKVNGNVIGMDVSPIIASGAKRRAKQYGVDSGEYICCDVRHLPFKSNSIDLAISNSTLDHYSHKRDITVALQELRRVLEPRGTLILTMDNKGNLTEPLFRFWISLGLAPFFSGKTYSIKELKRAIEEIGFDVDDATAIIHNPRFFTTKIVGLLHRLNARKFDPIISKGLAFFDNLENKKTKYRTGLYIAVKAVKCETEQTGQ